MYPAQGSVDSAQYILEFLPSPHNAVASTLPAHLSTMSENTSAEEPAYWGCPIWPQTFYDRMIARSVKYIPDYQRAGEAGCVDCTVVLAAVEKYDESWCDEYLETDRICKAWYAGKVVVTLFVDDEEARREREKGHGYYLSLGRWVGSFNVERL